SAGPQWRLPEYAGRYRARRGVERLGCRYAIPASHWSVHLHGQPPTGSSGGRRLADLRDSAASVFDQRDAAILRTRDRLLSLRRFIRLPGVRLGACVSVSGTCARPGRAKLPPAAQRISRDAFLWQSGQSLQTNIFREWVPDSGDHADWRVTVRVLMMRFRSLCALTVLLAFYLAAADYPQRIVSLSPDLTEMVYGVGAFSRVVGVPHYDTWPPEVAKVPHLGQLHNPSLEKLAAAR